MVRTVSIGLLAFIWGTAGSTSPARCDDGVNYELLVKQKDDTLASLARENGLLREKLSQLESTPGMTAETLALKNYQRLQEIARDAGAQRQAMSDFEGVVTWMSANLSGYAKYIQAGSVAAGFAKVLPIPYAGQASVLTKFVSQGVLSLNTASVAIARYLDTSQKFIARVGALDPRNGGSPAEVAAVSRFADEQLLRDMTDVQTRLAATAEISSSTLSFMESVNHYVGSTDEYWNKTKSFLKRTDSDKKEKSFLSESTQGMKDRAEAFNVRLKLFDETARRDAPLIKSLGVYDELVRELEARQRATAHADGKAPAPVAGKP
jgi:hypothetical protein